MNACTGKMTRQSRRWHHRGWFRVFRFFSGVEVWFGDRWFQVTL